MMIITNNNKNFQLKCKKYKIKMIISYNNNIKRILMNKKVMMILIDNLIITFNNRNLK
jgi:hypothetical protein